MKNNALYLDYLASEKWKKLRDKVVDRDGNKCTKCSNTTNLHVHHLTYDRVGNEELTDLITLCKACHENEHGKVFSNKYSIIKNLNFKGSIMDLANYQSELCKSSKDIKLFWDILYTVNRYNELRINISEFAKLKGYSRQRITKFLSDAVKINFMKRIERGVYEVNPFTFKSKGATNKIIEEKQQNW